MRTLYPPEIKVTNLVNGAPREGEITLAQIPPLEWSPVLVGVCFYGFSTKDLLILIPG